MTIKAIAFRDVFSKICVRPPYFALQNLRTTGQHIVADIPIEQPLGTESGPISGAEVGRHLAILGLCALALDGTRAGRHYYLAHRGQYHHVDMHEGNGATLWAQAVGTKNEKRSAASHIELFDRDHKIVTLDVDYHVLAENTFTTPICGW